MAKTINQSAFIKKYNDDHKHKFNEELFEKKDEDLILAMIDNIRSIERDQSFTIKIMSIDVFKDYSQIQRILKMFVNDGTLKIQKKMTNTSIPPFDKILLEDSDYYLMIVKYFLRVNNPKLNEPSCQTLDVPILLPKVVDKYYFRLGNKYYKILSQITDYSTYNNATSRVKKNYTPTVTIISIFAPIKIDKKTQVLHTIDGIELECADFQIHIFSKVVNHFKYTMAKLGLENAMQFYNLQGYAIYDEYVEGYDDCYIFEIQNKKCISGSIYVYVNKYLFDIDPVLQSNIYAIIDGISTHNKPFSYNNIFSTEFWLISISFATENPSLDKSMNILKSLESSYDIRTFKKQRLPIEDKQTIYHILRWVVREFDILSVEDRLLLDKKRVQWAENIANAYSVIITKKIHNLSDKGASVKLKDIEKGLRTAPSMLLNLLKGKFKLTPYRDLVNDLDGITALKYTFKDAQVNNRMDKKNNKGAKKSTRLPIEFSDTNVSHLGRLDLDSSPKSDPGMSGIICPLTDVYGEYKAFSDFKEPNTWVDNHLEYIEKYLENKETLFTNSQIQREYEQEDLYSIYKDKSNLPKTSNRLFEPIIEEDNDEI